jgi:hypothetical protein
MWFIEIELKEDTNNLDLVVYTVATFIGVSCVKSFHCLSPLGSVL